MPRTYPQTILIKSFDTCEATESYKSSRNSTKPTLHIHTKHQSFKMSQNSRPDSTWQRQANQLETTATIDTPLPTELNSPVDEDFHAIVEERGCDLSFVAKQDKAPTATKKATENSEAPPDHDKASSNNSKCGPLCLGHQDRVNDEIGRRLDEEAGSSKRRNSSGSRPPLGGRYWTVPATEERGSCLKDRNEDAK